MMRLSLATVVFCVAAPAFAAPPNLNWGAEINSAHCSSDGSLVINVTSQITGSVDSRVGGGYWATEDYNKTIQVWTTDDPGTFCARVLYLGRFSAVPGASPQNLGTLNGGEKGSFEGGYWATITGTVKPSPAWPTAGHVGKLNYGCDPVSGTCPGAVNWVDQYFDGAGFAYNWWGWTYHGGKNGAWVNSIDGNAGDISQ